MQETLTDSHINEDRLEEYILNRLSEGDSASLEEHLLICSECRTSLEQNEDFVAHARSAIRLMRWPEVSAEGSGHRHRGFFRNVSRPVWAVSLAGVALLAVLTPSLINRQPEYQRVELATMRGNAPATARVPANRAPELAFEVARLPARASYRIEVVTAIGDSAGAFQTTPANGLLLGRSPKLLKPGKYWARVYSGGELLTESGFEVTP